MEERLQLYNYRFRPFEMFLIVVPFLMLWMLPSYILAVLWDTTPINFVAFFCFFLVGCLIVGFAREKYLFRIKASLTFSDSNIKINGNSLASNSQFTVYYNNPTEWMKQWGWYGSYTKYKSIGWIGNKQLLDKIIIDGDAFYVKIKTTLQKENFEHLISRNYSGIKSLI